MGEVDLGKLLTIITDTSLIILENRSFSTNDFEKPACTLSHQHGCRIGIDPINASHVLNFLQKALG